MSTAADRVEQAIAEGRKPDPRDVAELAMDSKELKILKHTLAALARDGR